MMTFVYELAEEKIKSILQSLKYLFFNILIRISVENNNNIITPINNKI